VLPRINFRGNRNPRGFPLISCHIILLRKIETTILLKRKSNTRVSSVQEHIVKASTNKKKTQQTDSKPA
jgi:hypothetical protein